MVPLCRFDDPPSVAAVVAELVLRGDPAPAPAPAPAVTAMLGLRVMAGICCGFVARSMALALATPVREVSRRSKSPYLLMWHINVMVVEW